MEMQGRACFGGGEVGGAWPKSAVFVSERGECGGWRGTGGGGGIGGVCYGDGEVLALRGGADVGTRGGGAEAADREPSEAGRGWEGVILRAGLRRLTGLQTIYFVKVCLRKNSWFG